jgi:2-oxo-4-hydroxy-4-carboxy-5-ureidoimidazoline decarboxylase
MTLHELNTLPPDTASVVLQKCCGSTRWVEQVTTRRPFPTVESLYTAAEELWKNLTTEDWKEAFSHHPKIGDTEALMKKFAATKAWATGEQSAVKEASLQTLNELAEGNRLYEEKFGFIFIVFATGKSAEEMLALLHQRIKNTSEDEIRIAATEQAKITRLRLEKLLST